ncbi:hypothetical protein NIIDMKKI_11830 [Mycobacterium kansasii]|uniref:HTH tetR-type domain-containing protein n=1 Tax=Mycobacterium kansasii TaxID=1768 RepID=A0A7G1I4P4_MYCKA|nr:hypothetical protein NIIDMKKI_11830 [Mycobacterium kansasii]
MARQVRSEVTRRKILDAAVDVFGDVGYASAGWGTIIERTGMTKGALYHHFDSKEALASAIIEEGSDALLGAFRNVCGSASPALENMIHGTFAVAHLLNADKTARAAEQLTAVLAGFNSAAAQFFGACAGRWPARPGGRLPKVICETTSIPNWSVSRLSARRSECGCSPTRYPDPAAMDTESRAPDSDWVSYGDFCFPA